MNCYNSEPLEHYLDTFVHIHRTIVLMNQPLNVTLNDCRINVVEGPKRYSVVYCGVLLKRGSADRNGDITA